MIKLLNTQNLWGVLSKKCYSVILFSSWAILRGPAETLPVHCTIYIYALKVIDPLLFSWYIPVLLGVALALGVATASNNKQKINLCAVCTHWYQHFMVTTNIPVTIDGIGCSSVMVISVEAGAKGAYI